MILLVGGAKGGTGKTTLACNLAALRAVAGRDVLLVDTDTQGSASGWAALRADQDRTDVRCVPSVQMCGQGVVASLRDLAGRYQDVIIDAGGQETIELRGALVVAARVVIPLQASQFDVWTLDCMAELIRQARGFNPDLQAMAVLNRASSHPTVAEVRQARAYLDQFSADLALANTIVRDRIAYRRAAAAGLSILETKPRDGKAAAEMQLLYAECFDEQWLQKAA